MSILVIDTETTGLTGHPKDRVLEIGIAELTSDGEVRPVYGEMIRYDDIVAFDAEYINEKDGEPGCWIYRHSTMDINDTLNAAKDLPTVVSEVRDIVRGRVVTSYNVPFDFGRFLDREPWNLREVVTMFDDVMDLASERVYEMADADSIDDKGLQFYLLKKRDECHYPKCWVRSNEAYKALCPDDPMKVGNQTHRALDDALMEAHILRALL
ncbi:MAG: 3'-5' exonuclease [archaeon]|nr:3'-5' exonuclease [archaeon]